MFLQKEANNINIKPPNLHANKEQLKEIEAQIFISNLGYPDNVWTDLDDYDKLCNKYYNVKEYEEVADKIRDLMMHDKEVPQDLIDYMLRIKKIREDNNL